MRCRICGTVEGKAQDGFCWRCRRLPSPVLPIPISNRFAFSSDPSRYLLHSSVRNARETSYSPQSSSTFEEEFYFGYGENQLFSTSPIPPSPTTTNSTAASPSTPDSSGHYDDYHPTFECDDNISRDAAFRLAYLKNHDGFEKRILSSSAPPLSTSNLVPYPIIHSFPEYTQSTGINLPSNRASNSRKSSKTNSPRTKTRPTLEPAYVATPERPHVCSHKCGMSFVRKYDCDRHERIHTGICPFECVCGKRFKRSDALQRHKNKSAQGLNGPDCVL